jgi:hypothetical protein
MTLEPWQNNSWPDGSAFRNKSQNVLDFQVALWQAATIIYAGGFIFDGVPRNALSPLNN